MWGWSVGFLARLEGRDEFLLPARRHGIVVRQIHRVSTLAAGDRLEPRQVVLQLGERNQRADFGATAGQRVLSVDPRAARSEIAGHVADGARGRADRDAYHRLE